MAPFVEPAEFERGKRHASAYWLEAGEPDVAEAFGQMRLQECRLGMDARARLMWMRVSGILVGLRFDVETGDYVTSFYRRRRPEP